jgi:hypothetical protein
VGDIPEATFGYSWIMQVECDITHIECKITHMGCDVTHMECDITSDKPIYQICSSLCPVPSGFEVDPS